VTDPSLLIRYGIGTDGRLIVATFLRYPDVVDLYVVSIVTALGRKDAAQDIVDLDLGPVNFGPRTARADGRRVSWAVPARGRA